MSERQTPYNEPQEMPFPLRVIKNYSYILMGYCAILITYRSIGILSVLVGAVVWWLSMGFINQWLRSKGWK